MLFEHYEEDIPYEKRHCLNPYSNGICSLRPFQNKGNSIHGKVLILILMEYAL